MHNNEHPFPTGFLSDVMKIDRIHSDINMERTEGDCSEQSTSPSQCSSDAVDHYGDPEVFPRVGEEYQAIIPSLVADCDSSQLMNVQTNSEAVVSTCDSLLFGFSIPVMWSNIEVENIHGTVEFEGSKESQISNNEFAELKVEPLDNLSCNEKHPNLQKPAGGNKMEADLTLSQDSESKMDQGNRVLCPLPGLMGEPWTDIEHDIFLLGLYIFGKDLVNVKRFVEGKGMGDILFYYYGRFYKSDGYRRWSECRKRRSRRSIHGQKMFTGWRQQELLSRLFSHVSQDCKSMLLEITRNFEEGKKSFEEYVFALKGAATVSILVEAVGIGKGKQDLTGTAMEPIKHKQVVPPRADIPVGKACSSLTSADIIKFLTGNFRLSKARSNDLFWEAVWPRLLARGWRPEQPKDRGVSISKHSFVFLSPGVKWSSRRRLVKCKHYFDSISDVLNKVASDPGLLELEVQVSKDNKENEEYGWNPPKNKDHDGLPNKQRHCYLQPPDSTSNLKIQKFTIVDTSLAHGAEQLNVRELRSLPAEITCHSASSSLSSDSEQDTSENSEDEVEGTSTLNPAAGAVSVTDKKTDTDSTFCENSLVDTDMPDASIITSATLENHETRNASLDNDNQQRGTTKYRFRRKAKSSSSKYLVPISKQQDFAACNHADADSSAKDVIAEGKLSGDESQGGMSSPDGCQDMVVEVVMPNSPSASSSAKGRGSAGEGNESFVCKMFLGTEVCPEKPQSPRIDLNVPYVSPGCGTVDHVLREMAPNENIGSPFESETSQKAKPPKLLPDSEQQPVMNNRRQSTRKRPLTIKALEAIELGFMNTMKRKGGGSTRESNLIMSGSPRRVRKKTGGGSDVASSRSVKLLDDINTNVVRDAQISYMEKGI